MNKILFVTILTLILITPLLPMTVDAQSASEAKSTLEGIVSGIFGPSEGDIAVIVGRIIQTALGLVGIIFITLIIYGGFLYMTAAGSQEQVAKARTLIINNVIGLIIIVTAFAVTSFVVGAIIKSAGIS